MADTGFRITGMTCSSCAKMCKLALGKLDGVTDVAICEATGDTVVSATRQVTLPEIAAVLTSKGYGIE